MGTLKGKLRQEDKPKCLIAGVEYDLDDVSFETAPGGEAMNCHLNVSATISTPELELMKRVYRLEHKLIWYCVVLGALLVWNLLPVAIFFFRWLSEK